MRRTIEETELELLLCDLADDAFHLLNEDYDERQFKSIFLGRIFPFIDSTTSLIQDILDNGKNG